MIFFVFWNITICMYFWKTRYSVINIFLFDISGIMDLVITCQDLDTTIIWFINSLITVLAGFLLNRFMILLGSQFRLKIKIQPILCFNLSWYGQDLILKMMSGWNGVVHFFWTIILLNFIFFVSNKNLVRLGFFQVKNKSLLIWLNINVKNLK